MSVEQESLTITLSVLERAVIKYYSTHISSTQIQLKLCFRVTNILGRNLIVAVCQGVLLSYSFKNRNRITNRHPKITNKVSNNKIKGNTVYDYLLLPWVRTLDDEDKDFFQQIW